MINIFLWGAGHYLEQVLYEINSDNLKIKGIIDNDDEKWGTVVFNYNILPPSVLSKTTDFDYIIISAKNSDDIEKQIIKYGVKKEKIVPYWKKENVSSCFLFKNRAKQVENLLYENHMLSICLDSFPFEYGIKETPCIKNADILLKKIIRENMSLCRFGDGEFEIIRGKNRSWFQKKDISLQQRLTEVLHSKVESIGIAIAQNFDLHLYTDDAANAIRMYMYGETRRDILKILERNRIYYDAYVSRPYIIYKDKTMAESIFRLWELVWNNRNVIIVEGGLSRTGLNNDLLRLTKDVKRIVCPSSQSWFKYEKIKNTVLQHAVSDDLILISLGPTATVLAYDLAVMGLQAIDIGQIDIEYEWYLRKAKERIKIPGKMVAEIRDRQDTEIIGSEDIYCHQILDRVL